MPRREKAKGTRHEAKGKRGEGSDSVSPFSHPAPAEVSRPAEAAAPRDASANASRDVSLARPARRRRGETTRRAPTVAVVGAGRLGTALARALAANDYEVLALVSRGAASASRAAARAGLKTTTLSAARLGELPPTDIVFITTPDDAIAATAERLAGLPHLFAKQSHPSPARGRVVLHTSGALSSRVLAPLAARGFGTGSMHPLAAVSEAAAGAESLGRAFYCVEGDARASRVARRVVRDLGGRSFSISARDKALYHAAAVMTAGHTVALFDAAARLLASCGLDAARARAVLLPLLTSTLDNLSRQTPARALTGTFARADIDTVRKHLAALRESDVHGALDAYALLGRLSLRLAAESGADAATLEEIARALDDAKRSVER